MKKMTISDFASLKYGDCIYWIYQGRLTTLRYVGKNPTCEDYLIFTQGSEPISIYIGNYELHSKGGYYSAPFSENFIRNEKIKYYESQITKFKERVKEEVERCS